MSNRIKTIPVEEAVGQVLCHDLTRIVVGEMKGPQFKKGYIIQEEDIPMLRSMGKEQVYVWEKPDGYLHEDDAAAALAALCCGAGILQKPPSEGKIELFAVEDGLFSYNTDTLDRINDIDGLVIAARHPHTPVKAGDKVCAVKAIPLVIEEKKLEEAKVIIEKTKTSIEKPETSIEKNETSMEKNEAAAGTVAFMEVMPYVLRTAAVITTGNEIARGRIYDTFTPVLAEKLKPYGIRIVSRRIVPDGIDGIAAAIADVRGESPDLILCTGGMSVDPDDNTPGAIARSGASIITYGVPAFPGAMFLLAYFDSGLPVIGLPGCVMYMAATVFDRFLPRIAAGQRLTRRDFTRLGAGGLCLSCPECRYPVCPFGI